MSPQKKKDLTFAELVSSIRQAHDLFSAQASKAVNISLTLRNWSIGYYIERYERLGVDRAKYGERLMDDLSETLRKLGLSRCDRRELYRYRQFYLTYPQIVEAAAPQLTAVLQNKKQWQLLTVKTKQKIAGSIVESLAPQLTNSGQTLLSRLSFTHFAELLARIPNADRLLEHIVASHTTHVDVGKVAKEAGVKTLVLTHLVPADDPSITEEMWTEGPRQNFSGKVIVGKDLMEIET